jgi:hypothetical protein
MQGIRDCGSILVLVVVGVVGVVLPGLAAHRADVRIRQAVDMESMPKKRSTPLTPIRLF